MGSVAGPEPLSTSEREIPGQADSQRGQPALGRLGGKYCLKRGCFAGVLRGGWRGARHKPVSPAKRMKRLVGDHAFLHPGFGPLGFSLPLVLPVFRCSDDTWIPAFRSRGATPRSCPTRLDRVFSRPLYSAFMMLSRTKTLIYSLLPAVVLFTSLEVSARIWELWHPPLPVDYG